jgi:alpha-tubulin suppressor-like RCC1 family protein
MYGGLGNGSQDDSPVPVPVTGLEKDVSAVQVGQWFACALVKGVVDCWGNNNAGQLGDSSFMPSSVPVPVPGLPEGITAISVGAFAACALTKEGGVICWGDNATGELGNGSTSNKPVAPVQVTGLTSGVSAVSVGAYHACAILEDGGVECWGDNSRAELGHGSATHLPVTVPKRVTGF